MSNPFLAEIRIFPFNFAPVGLGATATGSSFRSARTRRCSRCSAPRTAATAGRNFALPNLQGCPPCPGQGPGLSLRDLGETGGETTVTLLQSEVPSHTHSLQATRVQPTLNSPSSQNALARSAPGQIYKTPAGAATPQPMAASVLGSSGGSLPHNNLQPYLTLNFCIALQGVFPARP